MNCSTCEHFKRGEGAMAKQGYHNCKMIADWSYVAANGACRFKPSRYVLLIPRVAPKRKDDTSTGNAMEDLFK